MIQWRDPYEPIMGVSNRQVWLIGLGVGAFISLLFVFGWRMSHPAQWDGCYEDEFKRAGLCYAIDDGRDPRGAK